MWGMLKSVLIGTPSINKAPTAEDIFKELCEVELELEQMRASVSEMEKQIYLADKYLNQLHVVYSDLKFISKKQ